jgi:putative ATP-dependent endonuclease of OLD family
MEYHGMGTRSWASMLTVKAFIALMAKKHQQEVEPFFPIIAAEEPEAHLHPNAQRTLYQQLADVQGQVIVSTHSPYLAAMADITTLRVLVGGERGGDCGVTVKALTASLNAEELKMLHREVMRFRGEVLFARAIILFEGVTEEQIVPAMFEHYFGFSAFSRGINCISVGGKNYAPFIKLACSLGIPVFIVSDNDGNTKRSIESQVNNIKNATGLSLADDIFAISYLNDGNDMEAELLLSLGLKAELIEALVLSQIKGSANVDYRQAKQRELTELTDDDLLVKMKGFKASYAGFLANVITRNPQNRSKIALVPAAFQEAFIQVERWLSS